MKTVIIMTLLGFVFSKPLKYPIKFTFECEPELCKEWTCEKWSISLSRYLLNHLDNKKYYQDDGFDVNNPKIAIASEKKIFKGGEIYNVDNLFKDTSKLVIYNKNKAVMTIDKTSFFNIMKVDGHSNYHYLLPIVLQFYECN
jgi:hypothetical protein